MGRSDDHRHSSKGRRFRALTPHVSKILRILFGTDATSHGEAFPQQVFNDKLYEIYCRFLEPDDEYFDYAPADIPSRRI
jgi:hypothetical protein